MCVPVLACLPGGDFLLLLLMGWEERRLDLTPRSMYRAESLEVRPPAHGLGKVTYTVPTSWCLAKVARGGLKPTLTWQMSQDPLFLDLIGTCHSDKTKPAVLRPQHLAWYRTHLVRGLTLYPPDVLGIMLREKKLEQDKNGALMIPTEVGSAPLGPLGQATLPGFVPHSVAVPGGPVGTISSWGWPVWSSCRLSQKEAHR